MEQNEVEKAAENYGEDKGEWITNVHQYFTGDGMKQGFVAGAEWQKEQIENEVEKDIYDSVYMEVVEFVEKDNASCGFYKDTANNLKSKYIIIKR